MPNFIVDFLGFFCFYLAGGQIAALLEALECYLAFVGERIVDFSEQFVERISYLWQSAISQIKEILQIEMKNKSGDFLNILGMIGTALLTTLIPFALNIFSNDKGRYPELSRHLFFNYVFQARRLPLYVVLIYFPLFLWGFFSVELLFLQIFFFWAWAYGISRIFLILRDAYRWLMGEKHKFRIEYLSALGDTKNLTELQKLWSSVWKVNDPNVFNEKEFFGVFFKTVDNLLKGNMRKKNTATELISNFGICVIKRSADFLVSENVLSKILEWHFFAWKNIYVARKKDSRILAFFKKVSQKISSWLRTKKAGEYVYYNEMFMHLSDTVRKITENAFEKRYLFSFYSALNSHIKTLVPAQSGENTRGDNEYYVKKELLLPFFEFLVKNLEGRRNYGRMDIWGSNFPSEWRVTMKNVEEKNYVVVYLRDKFLDWARERIRAAKEYDDAVNNVMVELFPNVCPIMWARILQFGIWKDDFPIKELIERPLYFGGRARPRIIVNEGEEERQKRLSEERKPSDEQVKETIELAVDLFGPFVEAKLKECRKELEPSEGGYDGEKWYAESDPKECNRRAYLFIFQKMLDEMQHQFDSVLRSSNPPLGGGRV